MTSIEAADHPSLFEAHRFEEHLVDLGEVRMNYASTGGSDQPALLLIPGQSESWWGYEEAMSLLADSFQVFAVDLRGQGRTTWTPGRYSLDLFANDLVRFIDLVIGRPVIVSGLSSGGVLSAWMSAYAKPGQVRAAVYEDPPLFASETNPACGPSIRQSIGGIFVAWSTYLGDQWSVGDWEGAQKAMLRLLSPFQLRSMAAMMGPPEPSEGIPQSFREYDPEWARAFVTGTVGVNCDHATMLANVKVPVLFTHHFRLTDETTGQLVGASADVQARRVQTLVEAAGQPFEYRSFPDMPHSMHGADPGLFAKTVVDWSKTLR